MTRRPAKDAIKWHKSLGGYDLQHERAGMTQDEGRRSRSHLQEEGSFREGKESDQKREWGTLTYMGKVKVSVMDRNGELGASPSGSGPGREHERLTKHGFKLKGHMARQVGKLEGLLGGRRTAAGRGVSPLRARAIGQGPRRARGKGGCAGRVAGNTLGDQR